MRTAAESTADGPSPEAMRLLWRFAVNIPDAMPRKATGHEGALDPQQVIGAVQPELDVHTDADCATRAAAARRARKCVFLIPDAS
ncbi:hypothetical protein ACH4VS_26225 [Streptomyces hygroscopicus]|uniref:hypothetical protein n=1 Tax=Streptomyces hygroscopicus TaxID=1912 RepID=UPI00117E0604|nr:hypothetical protein [Streptomyces hygroscopicus]